MRLIRLLQYASARTRRAWQLLQPIRVLFALWLLAATALFVPQAQDELRQLAESRSGIPSYLLWFEAASVYVAWVVWQWSRVLLAVRFPRQAAAAANNVATWVPRILGTFTFVILGIATLDAGRIPGRTFPHPERISRMFYVFLAFAVLFALYTWGRRLPGAATRNPQSPFRAYVSYAALPPWTKRALVFHTIVSSAFFILMIAIPAPMGDALHAPALVLLASALWITATSWAVYAGLRFRLPVLAAIIIVVVITGLFSDTHVIQTIGTLPPRKSADAQFREWLQDLRTRDHDPKPTIYLVAAEGGGIRAAYWTAHVLTTIQQQNPAFADHCFAISGVSGGGLGAAVFAALLASGKPTSQLPDAAHRVLAYNFLGPPLGVLFTTEPVQHLLPVVPDRAAALEHAWEHGWHAAMGTMVFGAPFLDLWKDGNPHRVPSLIINGTSVESGERVITSNLDVDAGPTAFLRATDTFNMLRGDLPVSRAVDMGARFAYVSPPGTIVGANGKQHVVDGGYFENSGALAIEEITRVIQAQKEPVQIVIITIQYGSGDDPQFNRVFSELLSPVRAVLHARTARAAYSSAELRAITGVAVVPFTLCGEMYPPPLGWSLSDEVQHDIEAFLTPGYPIWRHQQRDTKAEKQAYARCVADHDWALRWLTSFRQTR